MGADADRGRAVRTCARAARAAATLLAGLMVTVPAGAKPAIADEHRWTVIYTKDVTVDALEPYQTVVLDARYHPPLAPLIERGKLLLGYISAGEVEKHRVYYPEVEAEGILLAPNPNWPDARYVDVRDPRWTKRIVENLIPHLLHKGFHGVMLDTLDNPPHLERTDPAKYKGMTDAAVRLVRSIRRHYPQIAIMVNRGYEILPRVARHIDFVLGESVYAGYDFENKTYRLVPPGEYRQQVAMLKQARAIAPKLRILTLDYWHPTDVKVVSRIYAAQRKNGFEPYVATIKLDKIVPEPKPQ